jgi:AcrR family transcriptional regulator
MTQLPPVAARRAPKQLRSRRTVARILHAAARVFAEDGFEAATTNRVAERAEVSVGSLYQFFPNKAALLLALRRDWMQRVHDHLGAALAPQPFRPLTQILDDVIKAFEDLDLRPAGVPIIYGRRA